VWFVVALQGSPHTGGVVLVLHSSQCGVVVCVCVDVVVVCDHGCCGHTPTVASLTTLFFLPHSMRSLRERTGSCLSRRMASVACLTTFLVWEVTWTMVNCGGTVSVLWQALICLAMALDWSPLDAAVMCSCIRL
jgi:hypothetical protein